MTPKIGQSDSEYIAYLEKRIKELEDGSCRFNCRSMKDAFMAGFYAGADDTANSRKIIDADYREWLREQREKT